MCNIELLNELGKQIRCEALPSILSVFPNSFNNLNNTGARVQDSVYQMTIKSHLLANFALKRCDFAIRTHDDFLDINA